MGWMHFYLPRFGHALKICVRLGDSIVESRCGFWLFAIRRNYHHYVGLAE